MAGERLNVNESSSIRQQEILNQACSKPITLRRLLGAKTDAADSLHAAVPPFAQTWPVGHSTSPPGHGASSPSGHSVPFVPRVEPVDSTESPAQNTSQAQEETYVGFQEVKVWTTQESIPTGRATSEAQKVPVSSTEHHSLTEREHHGKEASEVTTQRASENLLTESPERTDSRVGERIGVESPELSELGSPETSPLLNGGESRTRSPVPQLPEKQSRRQTPAEPTSGVPEQSAEGSSPRLAEKQPRRAAPERTSRPPTTPETFGSWKRRHAERTAARSSAQDIGAAVGLHVELALEKLLSEAGSGSTAAPRTADTTTQVSSRSSVSRVKEAAPSSAARSGRDRREHKTSPASPSRETVGENRLIRTGAQTTSSRARREPHTPSSGETVKTRAPSHSSRTPSLADEGRRSSAGRSSTRSVGSVDAAKTAALPSGRLILRHRVKADSPHFRTETVVRETAETRRAAKPASSGASTPDVARRSETSTESRGPTRRMTSAGRHSSSRLTSAAEPTRGHGAWYDGRPIELAL